MTLTKNIISIAGKIPFVKSLYHKSGIAEKREAKRIAYLKSLPREAYPAELKKVYKENMGKDLDLENPKTLNEKIQWMKLYDSTPLKTKLADKYLVREWVAEKIGDDHLIPLLGVWDSFDEIDFDKLPNQFVLKTNHGSAQNIIVKDKSLFNKKEAKKLFEKWLSEPYGIAGFELHYFDIPRKIIAEKYMTDSSSSASLTDYKFYCFDGYVDCVLVCVDRDIGEPKFYFFNDKWRLLRYNLRGKEAPADFTIPKPGCMDEMFKQAALLSKGFAFVRVDLYAINNKSFFGEMTFTPAGGFDPNRLPESDLYFGKLIDLSNVNGNKQMSNL